MVFSSAVFLFYFLPLTLLCVGGVRLLARGERFVRLRNLILLCASCVFYAWGEASLTLLLLLFAWINYRLALGLSASKHPRRWLLAGVGFDLALLIGVKYGPWLYGWAAQACVWIGLSRGAHPALEFALPLGISFYTFQSLSYLVDVYRGDAAPARRFSDFACYLLMFSQLVAGPIIRYADMSAELLSDRGSAERMACGVKRFVVGLAKKTLIANQVAFVADAVFRFEALELSAPLAWCGLLCYAVQIYFDFSAYSDMAIGIGDMFGFTFMENFRHPYGALSMRDFWRRWHISLSTWFRDYLYIPLGGSRCSAARTRLNLLAVFLLCGLWHGANLTFVLWGAWHGLFLLMERDFLNTLLQKLPRWLRRSYVWGVFLAGWVFFRCDSLAHAGMFFRALAGVGDGSLAMPLSGVLDVKSALLLTFALIGSARVFAEGWGRLRQRVDVHFEAFEFAAGAVMLFFSAVMILGNSYDPFIYFRF